MTATNALPVADRALRRSQAAEIVGVSPKTLANWHSIGRGPRVVYYGRTPYYRSSDLGKFIESMTEQEAAA